MSHAVREWWNGVSWLGQWAWGPAPGSPLVSSCLGRCHCPAEGMESAGGARAAAGWRGSYERGLHVGAGGWDCGLQGWVPGGDLRGPYGTSHTAVITSQGAHQTSHVRNWVRNPVKCLIDLLGRRTRIEQHSGTGEFTQRDQVIQNVCFIPDPLGNWTLNNLIPMRVGTSGILTTSSLYIWV